MSRPDFDEFIRRQQAQKDEMADQPFDPEQQLREWREYLEVLYGTIDQYMAPYIKQGSAGISFQDIELNEEFSGPYVVPQMSLLIGRSKVTFKPVGTLLIGIKGRVDVLGPRGTARLGLVNSAITRASQLITVTMSGPGAPKPSEPPRKKQPITWAWKIITPAPQINFIELTENSFFDMILTVADA